MKQNVTFRMKESCAFITGKRKIDISGCSKVKLYTPEKVILTLEDGEMEIEGNGLIITVFAGSEIRLSGVLMRITLSETGRKTDELRNH